MIRFKVRNLTHELEIEMPVTDRTIGPVEAFMLDGAIVYVGGATGLQPTDRLIVPALEAKRAKRDDERDAA